MNCFLRNFLLIGSLSGGLLLLGSVTLRANDTLSVTRLQHLSSVPVKAPVQLYTQNVKGERFDPKSLLKVPFSPPESAQTGTLKEADAEKIITLQPLEGSTSLQVLKGYVTAWSYSKFTLSVKSNVAFELYLNNKKELSKESTEENFSGAPVKSSSFTAEPRTYEILLKCMVPEAGKGEPQLKMALIAADSVQPLPLTLSTENRQRLSIEKTIDGTRPSSVSISPDGTMALIRYSVTEQGSGSVSSYTEVVETRNGNTLMRNPTRTGSASWMPNSNLLYYVLKNEEGRNELRSVDPRTGKEALLFDGIPDGSFRWSPDETFLIVYVQETGPAEKGDLRQILTPADRQAGWRNRSLLHKFDLRTGLMQPLTFGYRSTSLHDISRDGKYLIFSVSEDRLTEWPLSQSTLFLLNLNTLQCDTLLKNERFVSSARFSPNGESLLLLGAPDAFDGLGKTIPAEQISNLYDVQAYLMDLKSRKVTPLTREFDPSIEDVEWNPADPNTLYFRVTDRDYVRVYAYDLKKSRFTQLPLQVDVATSFDMATLAPAAVYMGQSVSEPWRAYSMDLKREASTLLAYPQQENHQNLMLGKVEPYNFTSADGTPIYGRFYLPPYFDSSKKYPMIVYYYGGTTPVDRSFESRYPLHLYAAMGYVVYNIQPSGTIGFGQAFSARHVNAWGEKTADDIIEGTRRFFRAHPYVDSTKIGCIGASYGGFMTQYLQTRTNLFAAAVSHAGISSIASYWGEGYWGYAYSARATAQSFPWNNPELYTRQSPLYAADKINTPLLLLHGNVDTNVPPGESIQMFTALKMLGKEVAFIEVNQENHAIAAYPRRIGWSNSIFAWFAKWLQGKPEWWEAMYPDKVL